jgi:hypothetical protein
MKNHNIHEGASTMKNSTMIGSICAELEQFQDMYGTGAMFADDTAVVLLQQAVKALQAAVEQIEIDCGETV